MIPGTIEMKSLCFLMISLMPQNALALWSKFTSDADHIAYIRTGDGWNIVELIYEEGVVTIKITSENTTRFLLSSIVIRHLSTWQKQTEIDYRFNQVRISTRSLPNDFKVELTAFFNRL